MKPPRVRSRIALALLGVVVLAIMVATLTPGDSRVSTPIGCLICGERGLADVLLNIIMFLPVGGLSVLAFGMSPLIVIAASLFSAGVEAVQLFLPGRDASLGDLLFNTTGALLGLLAIGFARVWLRPSARALPAFAAVAAMICMGVITASGKLMHPDFTDPSWYALHTPDLGHLEHYDGVVMSARFGDVELPGIGRMPESLRNEIRDRITRGEEIRLQVVAGTEPDGTAPFLTLYDALRREIFLVGADGDDFVMRVRILAEHVRLDRPYPRISGALARFSPGDTMVVGGRFEGGTWCLTVEPDTICDLGMHPSNGWALLYGGSAFPPWLRSIVSFFWIGGLTGLCGFYARTPTTTLIGVVFVFTALIIVPLIEPYLGVTSVAGLVAATVSFVFASRLGRRLDVTPPAATP